MLFDHVDFKSSIYFLSNRMLGGGASGDVDKGREVNTGIGKKKGVTDYHCWLLRYASGGSHIPVSSISSNWSAWIFLSKQWTTVWSVWRLFSCSLMIFCCVMCCLVTLARASSSLAIRWRYCCGKYSDPKVVYWKDWWRSRRTGKCSCVAAGFLHMLGYEEWRMCEVAIGRKKRCFKFLQYLFDVSKHLSDVWTSLKDVPSSLRCFDWKMF